MFFKMVYVSQIAILDSLIKVLFVNVNFFKSKKECYTGCASCLNN